MKRTRHQPPFKSQLKNMIGKRVRQARGLLSPPISQEDLSGKLAAQRERLQITQSGISKIECGTRYVMDYEVHALAKALKVSVAWLFNETQVQTQAQE